MRRTSWFTLVVFFLLVGLAPGVSGQEQSEAPPQGKVARIRQDGNITAKMLKKRVQPQYPEEARKNRIAGTVRLHVIIADDGSVRQLDLVSGDPSLAKSAMDAVRGWKYRPTYLNGYPVEVDTTVDVVYTLKM